MSEEKININYTLADIEKYLQGRMSAKEMHEIERAAIRDPFLADAIEGYSDASFEAAQKDLNEITAALQTEKVKAKVVTLSPAKNGWIKIAALVILIAGAGLLSWFMIKNGNNKVSFAGNEKSIAKHDALNSLPPQTLSDSAETERKNIISAEKKKSTDNQEPDLVMAAPESKNEEKEKPSAVKKAEAFSTIIAGDEKLKDSDLENYPDSLLTAQNTAGIKEDMTANISGKAAGINLTLRTIKGKVLDKNDQPVPDAVITTFNNNEVAVSDTNGIFYFQSPDSIVRANVKAIGFAIVSKDLENNKVNNIVIKPAEESLSEVEIRAFGNKKSTVKTNVNQIMPEGGWRSFQEYVYKRLGKPYDSTKSELVNNADIELEFLISDNGNPYNFKILHSVDEEVTNEAIEAIKNGPRWIAPKKDKKAKVKLKF